MEYNSFIGKYILPDITFMGKWRKASRAASMLDNFLPTLSESSSILEIGPGRGEFARECQGRKFHYLGIEPSEELCQNLQNAGIPVIAQSVPPIPLESNSFDLIYCYDFVEHLCNYINVMQFLLEAFRVLKPGGHISVVAPNYRTIKHLFFQYDYQHSYITTRDRLINLSHDCGFEIIRSACFLLWISPYLNKIDRIVAHTLIPISTNPLFECFIVMLSSETFLFRAHKNLCDHVGVLARKPQK